MKRLTRTAAAAAIAIGASIALALPAQAGTDLKATTAGAYGYFGAYSETVNVKDTLEDGSSARVRLYNSTTGARLTTVWASGLNATNSVNLNLAEGTRVRLEVCRVNKTSGYVYNCSTAYNGIA